MINTSLRLVLMDDNPDDRASVIHELQREFPALQVEQFADAIESKLVSEAIEVLKASPLDVLVSDIGLPGEDGHSLIVCLRDLEAERGKSLPAVALTAYA